MKNILAALALLTLAGCAGTSVNEVATALAADKASVCVVVHNAFPPFANDFTFIRQGEGAATAPSCSSGAVGGSK